MTPYIAVGVDSLRWTKDGGRRTVDVGCYHDINDSMIIFISICFCFRSKAKKKDAENTHLRENERTFTAEHRALFYQKLLAESDDKIKYIIGKHPFYSCKSYSSSSPLLPSLASL